MAFNNIPPNGFPQIPDIEDLEAVVKDVATLKAAKAAKTDIAPEFSATNNYAVGDMVYHEGTLYVCSTAHAAAAWDAQDFTAASVASEVSGLVSDVSDLNGTKANQITIAPFFNPEASYEVGDLVYYNGLSYRCTNDHEGAWDADDFAATTIAGELSRLNSNINTLFASVVTVNTVASGQTETVAYPTGYGFTNTRVISYFITDGTTRFFGDDFAKVVTTSSGVELTNRSQAGSYKVGAILIKV